MMNKLRWLNISNISARCQERKSQNGWVEVWKKSRGTRVSALDGEDWYEVLPITTPKKKNTRYTEIQYDFPQY